MGYRRAQQEATGHDWTTSDSKSYNTFAPRPTRRILFCRLRLGYFARKCQIFDSAANSRIFLRGFVVAPSSTAATVAECSIIANADAWSQCLRKIDACTTKTSLILGAGLHMNLLGAQDLSSLFFTDVKIYIYIYSEVRSCRGLCAHGFCLRLDLFSDNIAKYL